MTSTVRQDSVDEYSGALFGEVQVWPLPRLRAMLGLRADLYGYDVASDLTANSGRGSAAIATPKFALAWNPVGPIELYADYGEGFHSNDARGATISVDPGSGAPAGSSCSPVPAAPRSARGSNGRGSPRRPCSST